MMSFTMKMTKKRAFMLFALIIAVLFVIVCGVLSRARDPGKPGTVTAATDTQRIAFLRAYGWQASPEAVSAEDVKIPMVFNAVYASYNAMQKAQGFDLSPYSGEDAVEYTYTLTNYPGGAGDVVAHLLVIDGKIVGGDITELSADGFILGFHAVQSAGAAV